MRCVIIGFKSQSKAELEIDEEISSIYQKNDLFLCELQLEMPLTKEKIFNYKKSIGNNKHFRILE